MNQTAQGVDARPVARPGVAPYWIAFALLGATVAFYFGDLRAMAARWASSEELSHGFLVAAVVPVLFWLQRHEVTLGRIGSPLAMVGLLVTTLGWVMARGANVDLVQWILLPGILWFALWAALGGAAAWALLFPVAYFLLAIPVWNLVLTPVFQWITVQASTLLLAMAGVQAYIDGAFVQVPAGNFEIAGGCSGMNYLIVGIATASLFAFVERLPWRRTLAVLAVAVAIAMVANWLRVSYVIYDGNATAMQSPLVEDHATFGWYVFAVAMVPFFIVARRIAKDAPAPAAIAPRGPEPVQRALPALLVGVVALGAGAAWGAAVDLATAREPAPELQMPAVAGWDGPGLAEPDWHPSFPGAAATRLVGYRRGADVVDAFAAFFTRQSELEKLIGYYASLAGQGEWTDRGHSAIEVRDGQGGSAPAREHVLVDAAGNERLVWSWYEVRGDRSIGTIDVKARESLRVLGFAPRSGIVALSARCVPDCDAARAALTDAYAAGLAGASAGTAVAD
jgi:exosortase A